MSKPLLDIMNLNLVRYGSSFDKEKFLKTFKEEIDEVFEALEGTDIEHLIGELNDVIVVAAGAITQLGYNPELALKQTVKKITSRQQDPVQAQRWSSDASLQPIEKWLKNIHQDPSTLYKVDFSTCKLPEER